MGWFDRKLDDLKAKGKIYASEVITPTIDKSLDRQLQQGKISETIDQSQSLIKLVMVLVGFGFFIMILSNKKLIRGIL